MAGQIHKMINLIIAKKSGGNPTLKNVIKTKLVLAGINPQKYGPNSEDEPNIIKKLNSFAKDIGINL